MEKYLVKSQENLDSIDAIIHNSFDTLEEATKYIEENKKDLRFRDDNFTTDKIALLEGSACYDEDIGSEIKITIEVNDSEIIEENFGVQLCGGEYQKNMGCWITCANFDGDVYFDEFRNGYFTPFLDYIINTAEEAYDNFENNELDDGGEWEEIDQKNYNQISATCLSHTVIEKRADSNEEEDCDCYRTYNKTSGFISINDYAQKPELNLQYWDSLESARNYLENN
ncbi:MAG: hypothetical protein AB7P94_17235 [Steroidobacteraceae bacterium]